MNFHSLPRFLFTAGLVLSAMNAQAMQPVLSYATPSTINAGDMGNFEIIFYGTGLAPAYSLGENQKDVEVNYRKVGQDMTPWATATNTAQDPGNPKSGVSISMLGNQNIEVTVPLWLTAKPGKLEFTVCIRTVGCSNILAVPVLATSTVGSVSIQNTEPYDVPVPDPAPGYVATVMLNITGLTTYAPSMKIGKITTEGLAHPQENQAWFYLDSKALPTVGLYTATVVDPYAGESGNTVFIRAFKKPAVTVTNPVKITELISTTGTPKDTTVQFTFDSFTYPSAVTITDSNGQAHTINPAIDVLTNKLTIAIPAAWLKKGDSQLSFNFSNVAGSASTLVPVSVTTMIRLPGGGPNPPRP